MRFILDRWQGGIAIEGTKISNLRYADDTLLITSNQEKLVQLIDRLKIISQQYGLKINRAKTKIMVVSRGEQNVGQQYLKSPDIMRNIKTSCMPLYSLPSDMHVKHGLFVWEIDDELMHSRCGVGEECLESSGQFAVRTSL